MTTKQAKQIEWRELIDTALTVPGGLSNTYNRFYDYSYMNQIFLMMQGVHEPVATYKKWAELDRQVKKGSKAKEIIRPIMFAKDKDDESKKEYIVRGFKPIKCIFGLSETDGEELPAVELSCWNLDKALKVLEITKRDFDHLNGNVQGFSSEREFAINPLAAYPLKTTMHELAHIVLGHTDKEVLHEYREHRGLKEFQAESTAYLLMNELSELDNVNAAESRAYIQEWLNNEKPDDKAIRQVFAAVNKILKAGR